MIEDVFATPRVRALFPKLDELAARFAARLPGHDRDGTCPVENFDELRELGLGALSVPAAYGGQGYTLPETLLVVERLAVGCPSTALILAMTLHLVGGQTYPPEVQARLCRDVLAGALINSVASEPELGSPSRGALPETTASETPDGWVLNGRKTFATGAPVLTHFLVQARVGDEIGEFSVPREQVRVENTWQVLGMRPTASHDILLENARGELLRRFTGERFKQNPRPWFYLSVAAVYLGLARTCGTEAARYARERKPTNLGGRTIAELESIQRLMGELEADVLAARALVYSVATAWTEDPRPELAPQVGLAKIKATDAALNAAQCAVRVVGGAAMSRTLAFERLLRDAQAGPFHPPNTAQALQALGLQALRPPSDPGGSSAPAPPSTARKP